jgi:hypothetical protein
MMPVSLQPSPFADQDIALPSDFVVRVAGLPVHHVQRLRFTQTVSLIQEWLELEHSLASESSAISDRLFELIGNIEDATARGSLIALRRSIFNGQAPKKLEVAAPNLTPVLIERIAMFDQQRQRQLWIVQNGQHVLDQEWLALRDQLRDTAQNPEFQRGLLLSSRDLHTEVLEWLSKPLAPTSRRKLELSLTQYIVRASTKTSPFSTFTSLARGRWDKGKTSSHWVRYGYGELSRSVANQLMQTFAGWENVRDTLLLAVNPSLQRIDDGWRFLSWRGAEKFSTVRHQKILQTIIESIQECPQSTYRNILDMVFGEEQHTAGRKLLDQLIAFGTLELHYRMAEREPEHFKAFCAQVINSQFDDPEIWQALQQIGAGLEQFEYVPAAAKQKIDAALAQLCALPRLKERGLTMPTRNTIFEDTYIPELEYALDPNTHTAVNADLERLTKLFSLYDPSLLQRQQALLFFTEHHADTEMDLLTFYQAFQLSQPPVVADLRLSLLEELNQYISSQQGKLERVWVDGFIKKFPTILRTSRAVAYYVQPIGSNAFVINAWQAGTGRAKARLRRFERKLGFETPETIPVDPTQPIPVDLGGVFGTNINLREPITQYEIAYPGYNSDRTATYKLALNEIKVRHCPSEQRLQLISSQLNSEIEPIHTGLLGEIWLPPLFKFLISVFAAAPIDPTIPHLRPLTLSDHVQYTPRLTLEGLVIERGRWTMNLNALPTQNPGEPLFHHLKNLAIWRSEHGIPNQVFIQYVDTSISKPTYVDFQSAFCVDLLRRLIGHDSGFLVMHEVLPELGSEAVQHQDGAFVHELVLEAQVKRWDA